MCGGVHGRRSSRYSRTSDVRMCDGFVWYESAMIPTPVAQIILLVCACTHAVLRTVGEIYSSLGAHVLGRPLDRGSPWNDLAGE